MAKIGFNNKPNPFSQSLKEKVDSYFENRKLNPTGNAPLFFKNVFLVSALIANYIILVFFTPVFWIAIPLCIIMGVNLALIGFNVMHDGGHGSISKHKWVNGLSGYSLNLMGGNIHFWKMKHNISHHTYTNIEGEDHDINLKPFMRMSENQPHRWFHKYQYVYWVFLYCLSYVMWVLYDDFQRYFTGKMGVGGDKHTFSVKEHFIFWGTKIFYLAAYIVLPIILLGVGKMLVGYAIVSLVCGFAISIVFQLAHAVEITDFPLPDVSSQKIQDEWAIHQINTTADFATKSLVWAWLLGGLNFQVEHHLFPRVSHVYYMKLRPLVKATCEEFGLTYNEYPSFRKALKSHLLHLKKLGSA